LILDKLLVIVGNNLFHGLDFINKDLGQYAKCWFWDVLL